MLEAGRNQLLNETDYHLEAKYQKRFYQLLKTDKKFSVPKICEPLTTTKILAMEYKEGVTIDQVAHFNQKTKNSIINCLVELAFKEIFEFKLIQQILILPTYMRKIKKNNIANFGATSKISKYQCFLNILF